MIDFLNAGGLAMWPIYLLSVLALFLFFQRWLHLHRAQIKSSDFLKGIFNNLQRGNILEVISICDETPGPVAQIIRAGVLEHKRGPERIQQVMQEVGHAEIERMEKYLGLLLTIAQTLPLLGLLGTILGLIQMMDTLRLKAPLVLAGDFGAGMWEALLTSAAGLTLAIPIYAGYNFLVYLVGRVVVDMERTVAELSLFLSQWKGPTES